MSDGDDRRDENHSQHEPLIYGGHPNPVRRSSAIKPNDEKCTLGSLSGTAGGGALASASAPPPLFWASNGLGSPAGFEADAARAAATQR